MNDVNGTTRVVGIFGWPVGHTLSPIMHNTAFAALDLNWVYVPLPIKPEKIKNAVLSLKTFNLVGANITVPHKQAIMRYLDYIDPSARNIGAVNTIAVKDGKICGYNTDCDGFLQSLLEADFDPNGARCLVLGAGGAARAVVYSLANAGAEKISVYNRTVERAEFLAEDLKTTFPDIEFSFELLSPQMLRSSAGNFDLVVNTTSLGMIPHPNSTPWPDDIPLPDAAICDLVYNPLQTRLLKRAEDAGLKTIDGLGMLIHQGAKSFEIWTGQHPPTDITRQAVLKELQNRE